MWFRSLLTIYFAIALYGVVRSAKPVKVILAEAALLVGVIVVVWSWQTIANNG